MTSFEARRTPVHRGPAAWSAILPGQPAPQQLEGDGTADVAVVGAGFAGLSAARRLLQLDPRTRVVVLEAGRIAEGASGRNSGFMIDLPHDIASDDYTGHGSDAAMIGLNRQAIAFARQAVEEHAIPAAFFDPAGKVNGAASPAADRLNTAYARHLATLGEPSERLDAQAMAELTGSRHYLSGLFTPGTVMLQPAGYIRALAEGLRAAGVRIAETSPVLRLARQGAGWQLVTPHGRIAAGKVILANNGQIESFGFARGRLMHLFLYASMTADLGPEALRTLGGAPRWGITPSDPMGTTMRRIDGPQGGNRIVTRTCASFEPGMEASEAALRRTAAVHRRKFAERFPALGSVRMEFSWAGHLCLSRNGVALMRELEPGLFAACVQNGLGTTRGTLTGIGAAELASGVESAITRHFAAEADPTPLPPEPLASLGASAYLRWKEWRAAAE
ncbi:FAD-binding oxidoreductase (plasmid) [Cereibacter sphaeroides]|uniref:NAD(P)/FAD-dependent oxidoreductase n=1 Tax=Cereibacter sphaeroides TaxID=1063 RepID=UPI000F52537C|nr:FAD-binding oxidoreductase [Cereibacter sphaeroides]AZB66312.1 FAD-binding oxidoreductase [Cereibacter sphaeroides]AZB71102.1 FAD-binding oxidoreductase [Cereibacter sphaeroides]